MSSSASGVVLLDTIVTDTVVDSLQMFMHVYVVIITVLLLLLCGDIARNEPKAGLYILS